MVRINADMRKSNIILGIDSWTGGASNYSRLVTAFEEVGLSLKLVHFGSLGHDVGRNKEEVIDRLPVYDISYYRDQRILSVIKHESPAAVLFLSTEAFLHRAAIRYCRSLNIPTIHLYHGLISVQAVEGGNPDHYSLLALIKMNFSRAYKNIFRILPIYIESLLKTEAGPSDFLQIGRDLLTKVLGGYNKVAAPDAATTCCLVYADSDIVHANTKYRIPKERIFVVGNPDYIKFKLIESDHLSAINNQQKSEIIYIDHGGSNCGLNFKSENEFLLFLTKLNNELNAQGFRLKIKLHPSQYMTTIPEKLREVGINITTDDSFLIDLKSSAAAIVGPSTAAMIPAILGLPVFLARFEQFRDQKYGKSLTSYPRAHVLATPQDLSNILSKCYIDNKRRECIDWIARNIGPLPASDMPKRVAHFVKITAN
jgi:hypothetical protein